NGPARAGMAPGGGRPPGKSSPPRPSPGQVVALNNPRPGRFVCKTQLRPAGRGCFLLYCLC
ncbi:MAG TPA: hypothetical protein VFO93_06365, partial [Hymenobacter sp.]|uniref:hypothetical protein n=1 Tax=Hymenobacter sp. TaxID=1898978 RepID=UPI002D7F5735